MALQVKEMLLKAGFELDKWNYNSHEILSKLSAESVAESQRAIPGSKNQSVLGIQWNTKNNEFKICINLAERLFTKWGMLSVLHFIYDPLGFTAPVMIKSKLWLREVKGLDWDKPLPPEEPTRWRSG